MAHAVPPCRTVSRTSGTADFDAIEATISP